MASIHVAAVHEDPEPVLAAVRELGAEKVILVGEEGEETRGAREVLEPLGVETETRAVEGSMLIGTLQLVQDIAFEHDDRREDIVVNLAGAGRYEACALLSAAFVAGVRAIDRPDDEIRSLPALNFSYDEVVGADELEILRAIADLEEENPDLNAVSNQTSLDSSTVSYLIRGGEEARGLESLGLVEIDHDPGTGVSIRTTPMGATLARTMRL